jgi:hypothetical protein
VLCAPAVAFPPDSLGGPFPADKAKANQVMQSIQKELTRISALLKDLMARALPETVKLHIGQPITAHEKESDEPIPTPAVSSHISSVFTSSPSKLQRPATASNVAHS